MNLVKASIRLSNVYLESSFQMAPVFSIILPTFNRAHTLGRAMESVIKQSYTDWELWVIDDGSTDKTKELVLSFNSPRVHYVYQENMGRSTARNNGISLANGKYIAFLDSDDCYDINFLESVYRRCYDDYVGMVVCSVRFGLNSEAKTLVPPIIKENESAQEYVFKQPIGTPRMVVHKELFKKYRFDQSLHFGEDRDLWVRMATEFPLRLARQAIFIEIEHAHRSINLDVNPWRTTKTLESLKIRGVISKVSSHVYNSTLAKEYLSACRISLKSGSRKNAIRAILASLYHYPYSWKFKVIILVYIVCFKKTNSILRMF